MRDFEVEIIDDVTPQRFSERRVKVRAHVRKYAARSPRVGDRVHVDPAPDAGYGDHPGGGEGEVLDTHEGFGMSNILRDEEPGRGRLHRDSRLKDATGTAYGDAEDHAEGDEGGGRVRKYAAGPMRRGSRAKGRSVTGQRIHGPVTAVDEQPIHGDQEAVLRDEGDFRLRRARQADLTDELGKRFRGAVDDYDEEPPEKPGTSSPLPERPGAETTEKPRSRRSQQSNHPAMKALRWLAKHLGPDFHHPIRQALRAAGIEKGDIYPAEYAEGDPPDEYQPGDRVLVSGLLPHKGKGMVVQRLGMSATVHDDQSDAPSGHVTVRYQGGQLHHAPRRFVQHDTTDMAELPEGRNYPKGARLTAGPPSGEVGGEEGDEEEYVPRTPGFHYDYDEDDPEIDVEDDIPPPPARRRPRARTPEQTGRAMDALERLQRRREGQGYENKPYVYDEDDHDIDVEDDVTPEERPMRRNRDDTRRPLTKAEIAHNRREHEEVPFAEGDPPDEFQPGDPVRYYGHTQDKGKEGVRPRGGLAAYVNHDQSGAPPGHVMIQSLGGALLPAQRRHLQHGHHQAYVESRRVRR